METVTILEDMQGLDVERIQAAQLEAAGLIYRCNDPGCGPFFHIHPDHTWADVEAALSA